MPLLISALKLGGAFDCPGVAAVSFDAETLRQIGPDCGGHRFHVSRRDESRQAQHAVRLEFGTLFVPQNKGHFHGVPPENKRPTVYNTTRNPGT